MPVPVKGAGKWLVRGTHGRYVVTAKINVIGQEKILVPILGRQGKGRPVGDIPYSVGIGFRTCTAAVQG